MVGRILATWLKYLVVTPSFFSPIAEDLDTFDLPLLDPETNQPLIIKSEPMDDPMQTHYILKESLPKLVPAPRQTIEAKQTLHLKPKQEIIKIKLEPMLDYQLETSSIGTQEYSECFSNTGFQIGVRFFVRSGNFTIIQA